MATQPQASPLIQWQENGEDKQANWQSENHSKAPKAIKIVDDSISADAAYKLACEGTGLLWRGDYQNAKLLLQAIKRRIVKPKKKAPRQPKDLTEAFHFQRQSQSHQARIMGMLLIELDAHYQINLRRAPVIQGACLHAYGNATTNQLVSLRELLGVIGAYEWHKKGLTFDILPHPIHPAYGVFAPTRHEYLQLIQTTPLPDNCQTAMDIGVGTGVISAILAKRGVKRIIATDISDQALNCTQRNLSHYPETTVEVIKTNLFPTDKKADLIVCNPPWLPARPSSNLEAAIYDDKSQMLKGFIQQAAEYLNPNSEIWLVLSDLAEHLGLRTREELLEWIEAGQLTVLETVETKASHHKALDQSDPLHAARKAEVTSLWRLSAQSEPTSRLMNLD